MTRIRASHRARYFVPIAMLALLGAALVACGDDDTGGSTEPTAPPTTTVTSPTTSPTPAASPTAPQSSGTTIRIEDNVFVPGDRTVPVGTQVTWQWAGQLPHSVEGTFNGQEVKSQQQTSGAFSFTFNTTGTFDYICGVHGQAMAGRIVVQ